MSDKALWFLLGAIAGFLITIAGFILNGILTDVLL